MRVQLMKNFEILTVKKVGLRAKSCRITEKSVDNTKRTQL